MIDLFISLGLGVYYFFFRYVPALGVAPFAFMRGFKFFIVVATVRAACTTWGILSVLFRNVRQVKLFYTVFIINLLVAVWLMIPVLSLSCKCDNYFQCEALQSFAMDGLSLNKKPEPEYFGNDRKVPYEVEPPRDNPWPAPAPPPEPTQEPTTSTTKESTKAKETVSPENKAKESASLDNKAKESASLDNKAKESASLDNKKTNVAEAKDMAEATQNAKAAETATGNAAALMQRTDHAGEEAHDSHDHSDLSLEDLISMGHSRVVSKRRQRNKRVEASLLQMESSDADPKKDDGDAKSEDAKGNPKQDDMKSDASQIEEGNEDIQLKYFKSIGKNKLVSDDGKIGECTTGDGVKKTVKGHWAEDQERMNVLEGLSKEKEKDHDKSFLQTVAKCLANVNSCEGIVWTVQKDDDEEHYHSKACTIIGSTTTQDETEAEIAQQNEGTRSIYLQKRAQKAKELVSNQNVMAQIRRWACKAADPAEKVACHQGLYNSRCRCDATSCRSYTKSDTGSEQGWCYIDNKTLPLCWQESKEVHEDSKKRPFTTEICHQAESYEASCKCKGIGMVPPDDVYVDETLKGDYGSSCAKWNGNENKFKWCFVGWDSPCVDRRRSDPNGEYKAAGLELGQFWSEVACDTEDPNKRIIAAGDRCENLEYAMDSVCLVHLFLSVPMIMVLYNYISNRCGDDIQTVEQFAVESSSDDEDMPAGQTRKSNDSTASFAKATPPVPAFEGATESH